MQQAFHTASERAINTKESLLKSIDETQVLKTARPISLQKVESSRAKVVQESSCFSTTKLSRTEGNHSDFSTFKKEKIVFIHYYIRKGFKILIYVSKC